MTQFKTQKIKETKTLSLTRWQLFGHYAIVIFLLIAPIMATFSLFKIYVTKTYSGFRSANELMLVCYPWLIPAIFFYFLQKKRLKFTDINICVNEEIFQKAADLSANKLGWIIQKTSPDFIRAVRRGSVSSRSRGEMITIIRENDNILINSICDPDSFASISSNGWNKKNINTFKTTIESLQTSTKL